MKSAPKWAQDLTLNALLWWESQDKQTPIFQLDWRRRNGDSSCGTSWSTHGGKHQVQPRILVSAGRNRTDAKLVLLHEIAHQLTDSGHTDYFWDVAWQLFRWAKLPIRYCQKREYTYRAGAVAAYKRGKRE